MTKSSKSRVNRRLGISTQSDSPNQMGYKNEHHLIEEKRIPVSLQMLRSELALPHNLDLAKEVIEGKDFEECIAILAAKLGILLDGEYDVPELCEVLLNCLRARRTHGPSTIHLADPNLRRVRVTETEGKTTIEDRAEGIIAVKAAPSGEGPYTICDTCQTSYECCLERACKLGKPATQLGKSLDYAKAILKGLN